jgi:hypothetical protein
VTTPAYPRIPGPSAGTSAKQFGVGGGPVAAPLDQELLSGTEAFSQVGITVAGGQGILPIGTVLGRKTADKMYYVYATGNSDGTQTARGVLRNGIDTGVSGTPQAVAQQANMVIRGTLTNSLVSGADSGAITTLKARTDTILDKFIF